MSVGSRRRSAVERAARVLFTLMPNAMSKKGDTWVFSSTPKQHRKTGLAASQQFSTTYIAMRSMCIFTTTLGMRAAGFFSSSFSSLTSSFSSFTSSLISSLFSSSSFTSTSSLSKLFVASVKAAPTFPPTAEAQSSITKIHGDGSRAT